MADEERTEEGWEARMAARHRDRVLKGKAIVREEAYTAQERRAQERRTWDFSVYREPSDPIDINPQILAARCLGITYGDPGPRLPETDCRECWGDRYVWYGNVWGLKHVGSVHEYPGCPHECHEGEVLTA
jgi:hypothetical protein